MTTLDESFASNYWCEVLRELDGAGGPRLYFPGARRDGGKDGVVVDVIPAQGKAWVGIFAFGDGGVTAVLTMPHPTHLCVIARGSGYVVDTDRPEACEEIKLDPILGAYPLPTHGLIVLHDYDCLCAYGQTGLLWSTPGLSWDGLKITGFTDRTVQGLAYDAPLGQDVPFTVNLADGSSTGGAKPKVQGKST